MAYYSKIYHDKPNITTCWSSLQANILRRDHGAPIAPFDKPEQVFELLNTVTQQALEAEFYNLFDVIVDVGADEIFDMVRRSF